MMTGTMHSLQPIVLPDILKNYFWDCDFSRLDPVLHKRFIAERILVYGNQPALRWLCDHLSEQELAKIIGSGKNLDPKTRNYWQIKIGHRDTDKNFAETAKSTV
jgi:hypothetical protein